jgi:uncharacterized protein DUF3185
MKKPLSIAFLAAGAVLLFFGIQAESSTGSSVSRFFTGAPTHEAIWLLVSAAVAIVVGLAGLS